MTGLEVQLTEWVNELHNARKKRASIEKDMTLLKRDIMDEEHKIAEQAALIGEEETNEPDDDILEESPEEIAQIEAEYALQVLLLDCKKVRATIEVAYRQEAIEKKEKVTESTVEAWVNSNLEVYEAEQRILDGKKKVALQKVLAENERKSFNQRRMERRTLRRTENQEPLLKQPTPKLIKLKGKLLDTEIALDEIQVEVEYWEDVGDMLRLQVSLFSINHGQEG